MFKKYCYFYSNNFKFCAVKKNYSRYIKKATGKLQEREVRKHSSKNKEYYSRKNSLAVGKNGKKAEAEGGVN